MRLAAASLAMAAAACSEVPSTTPDAVAIDTGEIGRLMPGAYFLLSWPMAAYHCGDKRRSAEVQDVKNGVVTYRCVDGD